MKVFLNDDYEAVRRAEALRVGLDENSTWDQIFDRTAILASNFAKSSHTKHLNSKGFKVGKYRPLWDDVLIVGELYNLDRIRKQVVKDMGLPIKTSWEQMAMLRKENSVKQSMFLRKKWQCKRKCPLTQEQKKALKEKEAAAVGLPGDARWKYIIRRKTNKKFEEEVEAWTNCLGLSADIGFAGLYGYITTRFADENRAEEAKSLGLKETSTWDEIFEAQALHVLDLRRLKEISRFGFNESTKWERIVRNRYLIDSDISREEAAKEMNLPIYSSWDDIMKENFTVDDIEG